MVNNVDNRIVKKAHKKDQLDTSMTQLQTIINNHMSLECHCEHRKIVSVKELISYFLAVPQRRSQSSHAG